MFAVKNLNPKIVKILISFEVNIKDKLGNKASNYVCDKCPRIMEDIIKYLKILLLLL